MQELINQLLTALKIDEKQEVSIEMERKMLQAINEYFYAKPNEPTYTRTLGKEFEHISEFHQYWEQHHGDLLNPTIDKEACEKIADVFHDMYVKYSEKAFYTIYDTKGLPDEAVCQIRYFSASQDFKTSFDITTLFTKWKEKPYLFEKEYVYDNPEDFLKEVGITLEQREKRLKFIKESAKLLIDNNIEAVDLIKQCDNDALKLKEMLKAHEGLGIKDKKADMFIRDMIVLNIWKDVKNFEFIRVASDSNTMKVALRTGILKTSIPLVSSFLDIFDYQHDLIYDINEKAWRTVWEIWKKKYPNETIESPSLLDYILYQIIGKQYCKENMYLFTCSDCGCEVVASSKLQKSCNECGGHNIQFNKKVLPCSHERGHEIIQKNKVLASSEVYKNCLQCPFASVCKADKESFVKYNPPTTISILSPSGWDRARVNKGEGGGGISA